MNALIVKKSWSKRSQGGLTITDYVGYYLFGFIPLYIRSKVR